jgi:hypothetical protein
MARFANPPRTTSYALSTRVRRHVFALALAAASLTTLATQALGDPCHDLKGWTVRRGSLQPGIACGSFVAATDATNAAFSYAQLYRAEPISVPFDLSVTWRRLGPEARTMEIPILGAIVFVGEERCALWINHDDVSFDRDGWRPLPGYRTHDEHRVSVRQTAERVVLSVDGREVSTWSFTTSQKSGLVGLSFKGATGHRAFVAFRDVRIASQ